MRNNRVLAARVEEEMHGTLSDDAYHPPFPDYEKSDHRYSSTAGRIAKIDFSHFERRLCLYGIHALRRTESIAKIPSGYFGFSYVSCKKCGTRGYEPLKHVKDNFGDLNEWEEMKNQS